MDKYFGVFLEFDHTNLYTIIEETIANRRKGYVCVVDANVLTVAQKDEEYKTILNNSLVNSCDGSSIAVMAGWIYKAKYRALNGPEIFASYIEKPYKQVLLGSTNEIMECIKQKLQLRGLNTTHLYSLQLPFKAVEEFNYLEIAKQLNFIRPDIIWVSLGAPKQEIFMSKLLPYMDFGVMFGIGAAFNFYIGKLIVPRLKLGGLSFIWLNRLFTEPRKLTKRIIAYLLIIPIIFWKELKKNKKAHI